MTDSPVHLWTFQGIGFSLTSELPPYDPSHSQYSGQIARYSAQRQRLAKMLGMGDIIWCSTDPDNLWPTEAQPVLWCLSVPRAAPMWFLDAVLWNRLLRTDYDIPEAIKTQDDESLWPQLLRQRPDRESQVVLPRPVPKEWIVRQPVTFRKVEHLWTPGPNASAILSAHSSRVDLRTDPQGRLSWGRLV